MARNSEPPPNWIDPRKVSIDHLPANQLLALAREVLFDEMKVEQARRELLAALPPLATLREAWLNTFSSAGTQKTWRNALAKLDAWCELKGLHPLALTPGQADEYAAALRLGGAFRPATVRTHLRGASSWYSWLQDNYDLESPFLGTRAFPKNLQLNEVRFPADDELETLLKEAPPQAAAAIGCLALAGIAVGDLADLEVEDGKFLHPYLKQFFPLPARVIELLVRAKVDPQRPFGDRTAKGWHERIKKLCVRMHKAGKVGHAFSGMDVRALFIAREWRANHDIIRLSQWLGHRDHMTTLRYLKRLGLS